MPIEQLRELSATHVIILLSVVVSLPGFWALRRKNHHRWFVFRAHDVAKGKNLVGALVSHFSHGDF